MCSGTKPEVIAFFSVNRGLNFRALLTMVACSTFHFQADNKQFQQKLLLLRTLLLLHLQSLVLASRCSPKINQPEIRMEKVFTNITTISCARSSSTSSSSSSVFVTLLICHCVIYLGGPLPRHTGQMSAILGQGV